jgi:hypothetical protein
MSEETELLGRFESTMDNMQKMLQWASAPFDERYDQCYLNLAEDELRTVANAGKSVIAYCDFEEPFIQNIELHEDVDGSAGMQSIIKVPQIRNYLDFVGGNQISMEFYGVPGDENKTDYVVIDGDLQASLYVPSGDTDYESKQLQIVNLYNDDNEWVKPSTIPDSGEANDGEALETSFVTRVEDFQKIIDVVSFESFALANYPVAIEDGKFQLRATDENKRNSVEGELYSENVDGPDVSNSYSRGFEELFGNINGQVDIQIEDDAPLSVVRESNDDAMSLRYLILPVSE